MIGVGKAHRFVHALTRQQRIELLDQLRMLGGYIVFLGRVSLQIVELNFSGVLSGFSFSMVLFFLSARLDALGVCTRTNQLITTSYYGSLATRLVNQEFAHPLLPLARQGRGQGNPPVHKK